MWFGVNNGLFTRAGVIACLNALRITTILCFYIPLLLLWPMLSLATPAGTIISNTAQLSYSVDGVSGFTQISNADQFTVASPPIMDSAILTLGGAENSHLYPGIAFPLIIKVENAGANVLTGAKVAIRLPANTNVDVNTAGIQFLSKTNLDAGVTWWYQLPDIAVNGEQLLQADVTLPLDTTAGSQLIAVNFQANDMSITDQSLLLNIQQRTEAKLSILGYSDASDASLLSVSQTAFRKNDQSYENMAVPNLDEMGGVLVTTQPIPVEPASRFNHNQVIFLRVDDADHNLDRLQAETIELDLHLLDNNEAEHIKLTETGQDTGIFSGYITLAVKPVATNDGVLNVHIDSEVEVAYNDDVDQTDTNTTIVLVDPYGTLFDSATGEGLNGFTVELINSDTGLPAVVYGDDGVSRYPSRVVSGGSVTDSGGAIYHFSQGAYRFPFAPIGNYKIVVTPPVESLYQWPSTKSDAMLASLPGAAFAITLGSRGESFPLQAGPPLHIDIPIDPVNHQLYIRRSASRATVAAGDFIEYRVEVENVANVSVQGVSVIETLPRGFRLDPASVKLDGVSPSASRVDPSHTVMSLELNDMAPGERRLISYVAAVGVVKTGVAESQSYAIANGGAAVSNVAKHETQVVEELLRSRGIIMGQLIVHNDDAARLDGIRLYMEDGRYAVTDAQGKYHFDNIIPGTHVIQIDTTTLPKDYQVVLVENNTRFAGVASSQFVDIQGGSVWRADFHLAAPSKIMNGELGFEIREISVNGDETQLRYQVLMHNRHVAVDNLRLTFMLPEGAAYQQDSSHFGQSDVDDPRIINNMLVYALPVNGVNWDEELLFNVKHAQAITQQEVMAKAYLVFDTESKKNQRTPVALHTINRMAKYQVFADKIKVETVGVTAKVNDTAKQQNQQAIAYDKTWFASQNSEIAWVYPQAGYAVVTPTVDIAIKHHADHFVTLFLNGVAVPAVNYNGMIKNNQLAGLSTWAGVDLVVGENRLLAMITNKDGKLIDNIKHTLHYADQAMNAEIVPEASTLYADGINSPVIAVRFLDQYNKPVHQGLDVEYRVTPPYQALKDHVYDATQLDGLAMARTRVMIGEGGVGLIALEPTTLTDIVTITFPFPNGEAKSVQQKLMPKTREWIVVGLAEGTVGYNTLSDNLEPISDNKTQQHLYDEGRVALFAKGQVLGKWLLTMAYDSSKASSAQQDPQLFQSIDPGAFYTIYGDMANNGYEASSSEKLYLKLERDEFYFLFGDYATDLNATQLAKYNRALTGIKSRYQDDTLDVMVFSSESHLAFVKDEFRGQSSTGPYPLSRSSIALNTDKVVIEVRDRMRSELVLQSRELSRHLDYDINYQEGTIVFREPVFSTDHSLNPQYIIVAYESYAKEDVEVTYGGRVEKLVSENLAMGVTHINEGRTGGKAELVAIDATAQLNDQLELKVEAARSLDSKETGAHKSGNAYLAELAHEGERISNKVYLKEQDVGFGLGQGNGAESGTRKAGVESHYLASQQLSVNAQVYHEEHLATDATRDVVEAESRLDLKSAEVRLGARSAKDTRGDGSEQTSEQITAGASKQFFDNKLEARIDREQSISRSNSIDYPNRTRLGMGYKLSAKTSLFVEHEITDGDVRDTRSTLLGLKSTPWAGGELYTGLTNSKSQDSETTSANVAGSQRWQVTEKLSLDIGAEQSKLISQSAGTPLYPAASFASGSHEDFSALSLGLTYAPVNWLWTTRVESRNGAAEDRYSLATSIQTHPAENVSTLSALNVSESKQSNGGVARDKALRLGLAYRPRNSRWVVLDKLDLQWQDQTGGEFENKSVRIINNFNANYKVDGWQHSFQYGAKTVTETISSHQYKSFVDLIGYETRYDINRQWDAGFHTSVLRAKDLNQQDLNAGVSVGHVFAKNVWLSLGYNFSGFRDEDFSKANYTSKGPFVKFRIKFDQNTLKEGVEWLKK